MTEIDVLTQAFIRSKDIVTRQILDEVLLVPTRRNGNEAALYTLDGVASFLWERLSKPVTSVELSTGLREHYDVNSAQAERDVHEYLRQLVSIGAVIAVPLEKHGPR